MQGSKTSAGRTARAGRKASSVFAGEWERACLVGLDIGLPKLWIKAACAVWGQGEQIVKERP